MSDLDRAVNEIGDLMFIPRDDKCSDCGIVFRRTNGRGTRCLACREIRRAELMRTWQSLHPWANAEACKKWRDKQRGAE